MSLPAARSLKRRATSDVDDPPARCPPPPSQLDPASVHLSDHLSAPSSPPASQSNPVTTHHTIAATTDDNNPRTLSAAPTSQPAPSTPPTQQFKLGPAISFIIDASPESLDSPPLPPLPASLYPEMLTSPITISTGSIDDSPPTSPSEQPAELHQDSSNICANTQLECRATNSPRLDLIFPCSLFANNIVILITTKVTSRTRWHDYGPSTTYVLHGADFVADFNNSLPFIYSPLLRLQVDDDLSVPLRRRLNRAGPLPTNPRRPVSPLIPPMTSLAHMAAMLLQERGGERLVTSFEWREPGAFHIFDIIPRCLLDEHVSQVHHFLNSPDTESDPVSEFTEPDTVPALTDPGDYEP